MVEIMRVVHCPFPKNLYYSSEGKNSAYPRAKVSFGIRALPKIHFFVHAVLRNCLFRTHGELGFVVGIWSSFVLETVVEFFTEALEICIHFIFAGYGDRLQRNTTGFGRKSRCYYQCKKYNSA
jgi:hypothetical protein